MASIDRRTFLTAACAATFGAGKPPATAQVGRPPGAEEFSFLLLGDTHFDRLEHHDVAWMTEHYQKDIAQVRDYVRKTRETLPLVLARMTMSNVVYYNWQMAAAVLSIIPVVVVYLLFQRNFVQGIALTGIKA